MELYSLAEAEKLAEIVVDQLNDDMMDFIEVMRFARKCLLENEMRFNTTSLFEFYDLIKETPGFEVADALDCCLSQLFVMGSMISFEELEKAEYDVLNQFLYKEFLVYSLAEEDDHESFNVGLAY